MARTYDLKDAKIFLKDLEGEMHAAAKRGLLAAAHRTVQHIVQSVIPATDPIPVDRGLYRAGWRARGVSDGAIVYNATAHAPIIEFGARAANIKIGRAMIAALAEWAKRKGLGARTVVGRSGKVRLVKASDAEATSIAWAIARSMQKKGIFAGGKGLRVLERAERMIPQFISESVGIELSKL